MKVLFWGSVTLQYDVKHATPAKKNLFDRALAPWRGRKKAHRHIRGVKKNFFKPPHDGY
jgi:hypothetical protein